MREGTIISSIDDVSSETVHHQMTSITVKDDEECRETFR